MVLEKGGIRAMQTAIEEFIQYLENIMATLLMELVS